MLRSRAWFCACIAIFLPLAAAAQELVLDFRATPLPQIVDTIARQTGQRFLYDESLRGNVTISVPQRVSGQEALAVLDAALLLHGFAAVPGPGGVRRIARIETAASGSPWLAQEPRSGSEAPVTTLIRLEAASPSEVGQALRQLAGKSAVLSEYAPTQSILIAAPENQVKRLLQLARALDQASDRELRVLQLRYRDVTSIEPLLEAALADERGLGGEVRVVGDERTGSLVVDARSEDHARVLALLRMLDLPIPGKKNLHVVRVLNVDAEQLAENLDALLQGGDLDAQNLDQPIRVVVDPPTHSLVIQAPPERFAAIAKVIAELDVPPERVSIEVTVVEASLDGDLSIGFDSLLAIGGVPNDQAELEEEGVVVIGTGEPDNLNPRPGSPPPSEYFVGRATGDPALLEVENPLGGGTIVVPVDFGGIIRAESGEANFHTVMQPHLLMTSGDEHQIVVGDNIPVPVSSAAAPVGEGGQVPVTSGLTTDVTFQRQDTGVDLRMTPKVLSREAVALELELSVSELAGVDPDRGPTITSRDLSASVRLRDGEVALIAALREPKRAQIRQAVPFLSRIPFLGNFFTVRREVERRRFLLISAQPMVLGTPADELARSIRLRVAFENQLARVKGLSELSPGPYALLVDTRDTPEAAEAVANELANPHWNVQVVPWSLEGQQHWDVYASGFQSLGAASAVSIELRDSGWQPRLTVLPERLE